MKHFLIPVSDNLNYVPNRRPFFGYRSVTKEFRSHFKMIHFMS
ncbi:hypothetical protein FM120_34595 [Sphingobacterium faecium PCAi_F2.5]|nr:hypothetical protein FM120_34595 [Sphingobacterium faecium PCAi_F2.5]